jgi:hypothetical protein
MIGLAFIIFINRIEALNHSCLADLDRIQFMISFAFFAIFFMDSIEGFYFFLKEEVYLKLIFWN